jgi:hypothetical protein
LITRKEAEKVARYVIASHAGEKLPANLFNDVVDQIMLEENGEHNKSECKEISEGN